MKITGTFEIDYETNSLTLLPDVEMSGVLEWGSCSPPALIPDEDIPSEPIAIPCAYLWFDQVDAKRWTLTGITGLREDHPARNSLIGRAISTTDIRETKEGEDFLDFAGIRARGDGITANLVRANRAKI